MPTIVFQANLAPNVMSYPIPANKTPAVFSAEVAAQRVTWFPNVYAAGNREIKDGAQFTLTDAKAIYMRDLVLSGQLPYVSIISTTP
jgi:hypothetical protein